MHRNVAPNSLVEHQSAILDFNRNLEEMAAVHNLNEEKLIQFLNCLEEASFVHDPFYWLSLARINELVLLCAGNYAESCEFTLTGDLLLNPRLILIHVRGRQQPIVKERHTALTEQFGHTALTRGGVVQWLKSHTILETRTEALLPDLLGRLKISGVFRESYVASIESREKRVADLCAHLACQQFENGAAFTKWLRNADPADRDFMKSMLCRFDFSLFDLLGDEIRGMADNPLYESSFLK